MRTSLVLAVVLASLVATSALAQAPMPRCTAAEPATIKAGEEVTVTGENLDKANVAELRLAPAAGGAEIRVVMGEQSATTIKFKVPASVKAGRWALVTVSKRVPRDLEIEQPVKITVE